ncbi:hypothetical protein QNN00_16835 [Bacillus velezensis]|nr:hypothetical protein [Bacillus velezensis]
MLFTRQAQQGDEGVQLEHKTMTNLLAYEQDHTRFALTESQFAAMSFDVCYQEMFSALSSGGTLLSSAMRQNVTYGLNDFVRTHGIQTAFLPTAFLKLLASEKHYFEPFAECVDHIIGGRTAHRNKDLCVTCWHDTKSHCIIITVRRRRML